MLSPLQEIPRGIVRIDLTKANAWVLCPRCGEKHKLQPMGNNAPAPVYECGGDTFQLSPYDRLVEVHWRATEPCGA